MRQCKKKTTAETICITQMNGEHEVLSRQSYQPVRLQRQLPLFDDASYLIVEKNLAGEDGSIQTTWELIEQEERCVFYYSDLDGFCVPVTVELQWGGAAAHEEDTSVDS